MKLKIAVPDSLGALLCVNFGDSGFPASWSLRLQLKASEVTSSLCQTPRREGMVQSGPLPCLGLEGTQHRFAPLPPATAITCPHLVKWQGHAAPPPGWPWAGAGVVCPPCPSFSVLGRLSSERCLGAFGGVAAAATKSLQSCPTLCDPRDGSPPGITWWKPLHSDVWVLVQDCPPS